MASSLGWNSFHNYSVIGAVVIEEPYAYECAIKSNCTYPGSGLDLGIFEYIADLIGLKYELVESEDGLWGENRGGNWTGILGMVIRGEAMMTVTTTAYNEEAANETYMTIPTYYEPRGWAVLTPNTIATMTFLAAKPFSWQIWLSHITTFIVISLLMVVIQSLLQNKQITWKSLNEEFWKIYGETLLQAHNYSCSWISPSLLIIFYRSYLLTMFSYYGAFLITSLMVTNPFRPFQNVKELTELIKNKDYTFLTEYIPEVYELRKIDSFRDAFKTNPPRIVETQQEAIKILSSEQGFVYMGTRRFLLTNLRDYCNVSVITVDKTDWPDYKNVFAFHKNELGLGLVKEFNRQISLVGSAISTFNGQYVDRECTTDNIGQAAININQIQSVMFVFMSGYPLALLVILIEKMYRSLCTCDCASTIPNFCHCCI